MTTDLELAALAVEQYAENYHRHVVGYLGDCAPRLGDRCDITAAIRHAARIVRTFDEDTK